MQGNKVIEHVDMHTHKWFEQKHKTTEGCKCYYCQDGLTVSQTSNPNTGPSQAGPGPSSVQMPAAASKAMSQAERLSLPPGNTKTTPQENSKTKKRNMKRAYGVFSKEERERVKKTLKEQHLDKDLPGHELTKEATKRIKKLWNALPQEEKDKYEKLAKDYNTSNDNEIHPAATDLEEARQSEERPDNNDAILHDVLPESEDDTQGA